MVTKRQFVFMLVAVLISLLRAGLCEEKCGANEEWKPCDGSCPKTCAHVANMTKVEVCTMDCNPGCQCKVDYVRNKDGRCVLEKECPCHEHAFYNECGTACPVTCENYANPPTACIKICEKGCACEQKYVRMGKFGQCVLPTDCSKMA